jgi:hypothetical protein
VDYAIRYILTNRLPLLAIPTTRHDSLLARFDRLGPAKETADVRCSGSRVLV